MRQGSDRPQDLVAPRAEAGLRAGCGAHLLRVGKTAALHEGGYAIGTFRGRLESDEHHVVGEFIATSVHAMHTYDRVKLTNQVVFDLLDVKLRELRVVVLLERIGMKTYAFLSEVRGQ